MGEAAISAHTVTMVRLAVVVVLWSIQPAHVAISLHASRRSELAKRRSNPLLNPFIASSPAMRMDNPQRERKGSGDVEPVILEPEPIDDGHTDPDHGGSRGESGSSSGELIVRERDEVARSRSDAFVDGLMMEIVEDETHESSDGSEDSSKIAVALPSTPTWAYSGVMKAVDVVRPERPSPSAPSLLAKAATVSAGSLAVAMLTIAPFVPWTLWAAVTLGAVAGAAWTRPWTKLKPPAHRAAPGRVAVSVDGLKGWLRAGSVSLQPGGPQAKWIEWDPLSHPRDLLLYWTPAGLKAESKEITGRLRTTAVFQVWARLDGFEARFSVDERFVDLASWLHRRQPVTSAAMDGLASSMSVAGLEPRVSSRGSQRGSTIAA